jgi:uncharacterized protein YqeY
MSLKDTLASDLKAAMLSGDKARVDALKMLKTAITYKEVELGARETGLSNDQVIDVFAKEAKKRADAARMYTEAGRSEQAEAENFEYAVIQEYLPAQVSDEELHAAIDAAISNVEGASMQHMGQIIGVIKSQFGQTADGAKVAQFVKEKLNK